MDSPLSSVQLHLVDSLNDAMELKRWLSERREILGVDTETTGLSPHHDDLRLVQVGDMQTGWALPWPAWGGFIREILTQYDGPMVAHNLSFDHRFLSERAGISLPWHKLHDTMTLAGCDDPTRRKDLKGLSTILVDKTADIGEKILADAMHKNKWTWATVPYNYSGYWAYSSLDPVLTSHLYHQLYPRVMESCPQVYDMERGITRVITNMMLHGMRIDRTHVQGNIGKIRQYCDQARAWLKSQYNVTSLLSARPLAEAFLKAGYKIETETPTGLPRIDKHVLEMLKESDVVNDATRQLAAIVFNARYGEKMIGTYLEKFLELADTDDIIHCSIHPMQARTFRMSVTDPALQTLHKNERIVRGSFVPKPGHVFVTADYDQIEARLAAHLSQDDGLIQTFKEADEGGIDFFSAIASEIFGQKITKGDHRRQLAKNCMYGKLYGASAEKMAITAGVPVNVMRPVAEGLDTRYPGLRQMMNKLIAEARQENNRTGRPAVRTSFGHYLPVDPDKLYTGTNYEIQCTAAGVLKQATLGLDAAGLGDNLVLLVHDEIMLEVEEGQAEEAKHTMEEVMSDYKNYAVPLTASAKIMPERWVK
jgi:DNA polymerase I-like protein with 3'-5' exonuclease and polymerase domains